MMKQSPHHIEEEALLDVPDQAAPERRRSLRAALIAGVVALLLLALGGKVVYGSKSAIMTKAEPGNKVMAFSDEPHVPCEKHEVEEPCGDEVGTKEPCKTSTTSSSTSSTTITRTTSTTSSSTGTSTTTRTTSTTSSSTSTTTAWANGW